MDQNPDQSQATPKQQLVERVRAATNVLVTVRSNPNVDELSAAIGLTLMLNKLGKHATAVFSGSVPSTIEFLKPENTIEQNTDSLRDFIVSLDKSKADKLRYKVEENVVKIFITPYRTSITQDDLEFTQGDFNVDVVLALGVSVREELDQAVTAHGRILHDATVATVTAGQQESSLGVINWQEPGASSLCEMLVSISEAFQGGIIDEQMATAFLTGIVAETERFSNQKTTPKVMTMSAQLMAAGANQQLIANELQKVAELPVDSPVDVPHDDPLPEAVTADDGSLTINHQEDNNSPEAKPELEQEQQPPAELPEVQEQQYRGDQPQAPEYQDPSLEVRENIEQNDDAFIAPLIPSESGDSYEPLLQEQDNHHYGEQSNIQPTMPVDIFAPTIEPGDQAKLDENQIHIDDHGNMMRSDGPPQPHHKVINPLPDEPSSPLSLDDQPPILEEQLPDLSALLSQPEVHAEISDVKVTETVQPLEAPVMPELDLPTLPDAQPAPPQPTPAPLELSQPAPPTPPVIQETVEPPKPVVPDETTLLDIEKSVHSPHLGGTEPAPEEIVDNARTAVHSAINQAGYDPNRPEPRTDLGAQPLGVPPTLSQPVVGGIDPSVVPSAVDQSSALPPPPIPPPMMPMQ